MRRIVVWLASTITVVVLLFGYHTSTNAASSAGPSTSASAPPTAGSTHTSSAPGSSAPTSSSSSGSSSSGSGGSTKKPTSSASTSAAAKTYTGSVAQTRWGPVQVQIVVAGGTITDVTVLQQPNGNDRDAEINANALPILIQDTLSAQSAKIDMVSGATVTSDGYVESLQAALDAAGR